MPSLSDKRHVNRGLTFIFALALTLALVASLTFLIRRRPGSHAPLRSAQASLNESRPTNRWALYSWFGKRLLDLAISIPLAVLLSPVMLALAVLVRIKLGSPILFRQTRPGLHGKPFTIYKFRTMTNARDAQGKLLPDKDRLTPFGGRLRSTSLDELPEIINVLRGDMSWVGPRPLLMEYLAYYSPDQMRRHDVRPGITGWAQVQGRNSLTWEEKFALDTWYVDHHSLRLDLRIMWMTVWKVLSREGINQTGYATAPFFRGSNAGATK
jgi:sugar transferase EpsL